MHKTLKKSLKDLKHIVPLAARKAEFRAVLTSHMAAYPAQSGIEQARGFRTAFFFAHKPAAALLAVAVLLTTGGGVTLAAQGALPGEALYPFKLTTEKVRVTLSASPSEKNKLHLEFASRRLNELEKIVQKESAQQLYVDALFTNYKAELDESQKLLDEDPGDAKNTEEIAARIDRATASHQQTIKIISEKAQKKTSIGALERYLDDADEHAQSKNESANLALLTGTSTNDVLATSTEPSVTHKEFREKTRTKIKSVEQKIQNMERALKKTRPEGMNNNRPGAEEKLEEAKNALENAKAQSERGSYGDSYTTSVKARKAAKEAERLIEKEEDSERDED